MRSPNLLCNQWFLFFAKIRTMHDVFKGMKKGFFSLTIPYLIANVAYTVLEAIRQLLLDDESVETFMSGVDSVAEFIFRSVFLFKYNMAGWYLFTLMLWIALTQMLFLVLRNKYTSVLMLLALFMLGVYDPFYILYEKNYTLFFSSWERFFLFMACGLLIIL